MIAIAISVAIAVSQRGATAEPSRGAMVRFLATASCWGGLLGKRVGVVVRCTDNAGNIGFQDFRNVPL